jgi:DNA-binding transcriptional regulator YiaG
VRVRAAPSKRSPSAGDRVRLILMPPSSRRLGDMFEVARLLTRAGVGVRRAKKVLDDLTEGKTAFADAPNVADYNGLKRRLAAQNVTAHRIEIHRVDVKALRRELGISQEEFAGRFGLDVATVRNWEQGRTTPDGAAAAFLQLIERDPDKVAELLAS